MEGKALVMFWSQTGNTRRVAETIHSTLQGHGLTAELVEIKADLDMVAYTSPLVFLGAPVWNNLAPPPVMRYLAKMKNNSASLPSAPEKPGHYAVPFATYGGGHTGTSEAVPLLKLIGQAFEHDGYRVVDEWSVPGIFTTARHPQYNTGGRIGDVTNRPNEHDLAQIASNTTGLLQRLKYKLDIVELIDKA